MEGFLETLRTENLKKGLHILVACPGFTASNIQVTSLGADGKGRGISREEGKMMQPSEVARRIFNAVKQRKRDTGHLTREGK